MKSQRNVTYQKNKKTQ